MRLLEAVLREAVWRSRHRPLPQANACPRQGPATGCIWCLRRVA